MKKLALLLSILVAPCALQAYVKNKKELLPVITVPMKVPYPGMVNITIAGILDKNYLAVKKPVVLVLAFPEAIQLPKIGILGTVQSIEKNFFDLQVNVSTEEKCAIIKYEKHNGMLYAITNEMPDANQPMHNPHKQDKNKKNDFLSQMRTQLEQLPLDDEYKKDLEAEINRLEQTPQFAPEYQMTKRYLEVVFALPWNKKTNDNLNIKQAREALDKEHYGLDDVKEEVLNHIAVQKLNPNNKGRILCLVGPPGTGKTSICKAIAQALGRKYTRVALGGVRDEADIRGHIRTYIGALPGRFMQELKKIQVNNPVMVLDEIDKVAGGGYHGDPTAALLEVLDPEQNNAFYDHYVAVPFDLSNIMFIATANRLDTIPAPLRDRMEIIHISGYTTEEKVAIAQKHIVDQEIKDAGLKNDLLTITPDALEAIVLNYTSESGVRQLKRCIKKVCAKVASEYLEYNKAVTVTCKNLENYLGSPKFLDEIDTHDHKVGVAHGLAWTPVGGATLDIEALLMPGRGKVMLTGQLGNVMQESAKAAYSYVKANADTLGIEVDKFKKTDLHIHVPAGATPKDGPSAGITLLTAMISSYTNKPVNGTYAMTGEIDLHGNVLPIGGLKEKVLAAQRKGYSYVIAPKQNEKDFKKFKHLAKDIKMIFVKRADEVIKLVFNINDGILDNIWPFNK